MKLKPQGSRGHCHPGPIWGHLASADMDDGGELHCHIVMDGVVSSNGVPFHTHDIDYTDDDIAVEGPGCVPVLAVCAVMVGVSVGLAALIWWAS